MTRFPELFLSAFAVAIAVAVTGCGARPETKKDQTNNLPPAKVRLGTFESKSQMGTEEVAGTVRPKRQATLEAKLSGRITSLPVVLGQRVKSGELLVRLDAAEIAARLDQAEAALQQAEREWKRTSVLFEERAVTRTEFDAAEARRRVAAGGVAEAKAMLSYVEVQAPFDGLVTKKWADIGDLAAPGKPLITIEDPSVLQLEADLPQAFSGKVHAGDRLSAQVEGVSEELTGVISEIAPAADPVTRTLRVKLDLPTAPELGSGRFARLRVPVGEKHRLLVPASAIVERGQLEIVFVVENQRAQWHLVKTGKRIGDAVEILAGLEKGAAVVIEGAAQLTDGQLVKAR